MKLIITQPEIEEIVRSHVLATVQLREGSDVKIDFTATRGDDGITATIDIPYIGVGSLDLGASAGKNVPNQEQTKTDAKPATGRVKVSATKADKGNLFAGLAKDAPATPEPAAETPVAGEASPPEESAEAASGEESGEAATDATEAAPPTTGSKSLFEN